MTDMASKENEFEPAKAETVALAFMAAGGLALTIGVIAAILSLLLTLASLFSARPEVHERSDTTTQADSLKPGRDK